MGRYDHGASATPGTTVGRAAQRPRRACGEVWWVEEPDIGRRPTLIPTRADALPLPRKVIVVPATPLRRGIPTEAPLDEDDGMPAPCALNLDNIRTVPQALLTEPITRLGSTGCWTSFECWAVPPAADPEPRPRFDTEAVFDDDYLYFYEQLLTPERTDAEVALIWELLELEPGMEVLDLACGHGRIANRLAARGARVTGLDATPLFLEVARRDAAERGVDVTYAQDDMRALRWLDRFDRIVNWFTSFGYFPDDENRQVLAGVYRALRPGGRLLVETMHQPWLLRHYLPESTLDRDGNWMIDRRTYDPLTGRMQHTRTVIRDGQVRTMRFFVRLVGFPELRDWMLAAGFSRVDGYDQDGQPLSADSRRMLAVARR